MFLRILLIVVWVLLCDGYSKFHGRFALHLPNTELSQIPFEHIQYIPSARPTFTQIPSNPLNTSLVLPLINYRFIDAGASGEVFLMQHADTDVFYIVKRFFKSTRQEQEDFIMKKMGYEVMWTKDQKYGNLMAVYPYNRVKNVDDVWLDEREARIVIYKIVKQLVKAHEFGFMHMDIKPANIIIDMVEDAQGDLRTEKCKVTIIDWNLANAYYLGAEYSFRRGTPCTMAPELILWSQYYTNAVDVWSLGVTILRILIGENPMENCAKHSLESMIKFIGYKEFKKLFDKLRVETNEQILQAMEKLQHEQGALQNFLQDQEDGMPAQARTMLRKMLRVDPEQRITLPQLLQESYLKNLLELPPPRQQKDRKRGKPVDIIR